MMFEGQDGSLKSLGAREFMVSDAYVKLLGKPTSGNTVEVAFSSDKEGKNTELTMNPVSSIIRLKIFLPDEFFSNGELIQAISLKAVDDQSIFSRYFTVHPDRKVSGSNSQKYPYYTSASEASAERNPYLRVDVDMNANTNTYEGFDPKNVNTTNTAKLLSQTASGEKFENGHFVTAYFALASKPLSAVEGGAVSKVSVRVFTDNNVYITNEKEYTIKPELMNQGGVIPMTIDMSKDKVMRMDGITIPGLGVTFAPGIVHADKQEDGSWQYGVYDNQGEYAGVVHQSLDFGEYFVWGSKDPTECAHYELKDGVKTLISPINRYSMTFYDVAKEVPVSFNGKTTTGIYRMPTKNEADRIFEHATKTQTGRDAAPAVNRYVGFYYYNSSNEKTRHMHPGATAMDGYDSASLGIYIGSNTQPTIENQDQYLFLPAAKQLDKSPTGTFEKEGGYTFAEKGYLYLPGADWLDSKAEYDKNDYIVKFSTNTSDKGTSGTCYRLQFWINKNGSNHSNNNVKNMETTFGRIVRPIIF